MSKIIEGSREHYSPVSLERMDKLGGIFRGYPVSRDPIFQEGIKEMGENEFLDLLARGNKELEQKARIHRHLYEVIRQDVLNTMNTAPKLERRLSLRQDEYFQYRAQIQITENTNVYDGLRMPDDIFSMIAQALHDTELHPHSYYPTLRRALGERARLLFELRDQSMSVRDQSRFNTKDLSYIRGNIWREPFSLQYRSDLLNYYGLSQADNPIFYFTNHGLSSPKLVLESVLALYPDSPLYLIGSPYRETNKFFWSLNPNKKNVQRIIPNDTENLIASIEQTAKTGLPTIVVTEAISSYKEMPAVDMEVLLKTAAEKFQEDVPFFLVTDLTTLAGVFSIFERAKNIVGNSNVNILTSQSLQKFFSWGQDLAQLGCVVGYGPELHSDGKLGRKMRELYYHHGMEPDVLSILYMPPIDKEYLEYRARMTERNALSLAQQILMHNEKFGDKIKVHYPGLRPEDNKKLEFIGFTGAYFFIDLPIGVAQKFIEVLERQPDGIGFVESGVSFGQDTTRVQRMGNALRVVPGTADICEIFFTGCRIRRILEEVLIS